ncbi:MAG TPA: hypothetical protein VKA85_06120, partial [Candidatus Limnocylindrales bacterium]|nr:hypothetical protein [Candidatus Limnocylindrales bacterium]
ERHAFEHMFAMGDRIALAIDRQFPARFPDADVAFSPAADLELTLDRLLGEHLVLAAEVMRAGLAKSPDFDAARGALTANTTELSGAIGGIYGKDAGVAFEKVWSNHIDAYLAYIGAFATGDANARADSLAKLHAYHDQIAGFLATANPFLKREDVAALIQRHVQALIAQVEAAAAGDHDRTVATVHGAYGQTFEVGNALATAISRQFPDRFSDIKQLPPTDIASLERGPTAGSWWIVAGVAASALLWIALRRRATTRVTNPAPQSVRRRTPSR